MNSNSTIQKSGTDWDRVDTMTDAEIDLTECEEITPEMFAKAVIRQGLKPVSRKTFGQNKTDATDGFGMRGQGVSR